MLTPRILFLLVLQHVEGLDDLLPRLGGVDDLVNETAGGGDIGIHELVVVLGHHFGSLGLLVGGGLDGLASDDADGSVSAHNGDLGDGPGEDDVGAHALAVHGDVSAAVVLSHDEADLGDGGLGEGVEQLGAVTDDAVVLLIGAGHVSRDVNQGEKRDVEAVAEADEAGRLVGGVYLQRARHAVGLVGHDADCASVNSGEAHHDVLGELGLDLKEAVLVDEAVYDVADVIAALRVVGDDVDDLLAGVHGDAGDIGGIFKVGLGEVAQKTADSVEAGLVIREGEVSDTALGHVHHGAAQLFDGHGLAGDGLDDGGSGDVHLAGLINHENVVCDGRGVAGAAGAGAHDNGDLGDDAGADGVAVEDLTVAVEGVDALFDAGAAGVVDGDKGRLHLQGKIHGLADLLGVGFAQGAAVDGEVLGRGKGQTAENLAVAGDDAVAENVLLVHAEVRAAGGHHVADLDEGAVVKEPLETLPGGQLARLALLCEASLATGGQHLGAAAFQPVNFVLIPHIKPPMHFHLICALFTLTYLIILMNNR